MTKQFEMYQFLRDIGKTGTELLNLSEEKDLNKVIQKAFRQVMAEYNLYFPERKIEKIMVGETEDLLVVRLPLSINQLLLIYERNTRLSRIAAMIADAKDTLKKDPSFIPWPMDLTPNQTDQAQEIIRRIAMKHFPEQADERARIVIDTSTEYRPFVLNLLPLITALDLELSSYTYPLIEEE